MTNQHSNQSFQLQERGNRAAPSRSARDYCSLTLLRDRLQRIVRSDLLASGERLLDYGCADKPYQWLFQEKFVEYVGADLPGNPKADLAIGSAGEIPCEARSFDCVLSSQVLEHVVDPQKYLAEARRVLRSSGSLILATHGIWPYHPDPTDYWRWTIDGLQEEIRRAGFEIMMVQGVFGLESSALQLWQDATYERLPSLLQPIYTRLIQTVIGFIERRQPNKLSNDASIYLILARKLDGQTGESAETGSLPEAAVKKERKFNPPPTSAVD
jgi:SAM-dependent methyltransferase